MNSRKRSRSAPSAARPTPANVPTAPFTTLEKSSKKRFCDCMIMLLQQRAEWSAQLIFHHSGRRSAGVELHDLPRSEEHTSELQSLMRISYAVFCLKKKKTQITHKYT